MVSGVKRSGVLIGVGVAVGLGLVFYGAHRLTAAKPRPAATAERIRAVSAVRPIAEGARIEAADLSLIDLPGAAPAGAVTSEGSAIGRTAAVAIPAHQILLASALTPISIGLAAQVPVGYRAISIQTNDEIAVSDLLRPGDIVDVELVLGDAVLSKGSTGAANDRSESNTLLQAVRVIAVGDLIDAPASASASAGRPADNGHPGEKADRNAPPHRTLTLAMTPEQVSQFTLARSLGAFYLALRNPNDRQAPPRALARLPDLRVAGAAPPHPAAVRTVSAVRSPRPEGVELVVGDQRQVIYPQ